MDRNTRENHKIVIFQFTMEREGKGLHIPREVWAVIMSYNNMHHENLRLRRRLDDTNEFADTVLNNLDRSQRVNETLFFQLRRLQGRITRLKRQNQVILATLQRERGATYVPPIATAYDSVESSSDESTIIDLTDDNEI